MVRVSGNDESRDDDDDLVPENGESQNDGVDDFLNQNDTPSEKGPQSKSLHTRQEIVEAVAVPMFAAMKADRCPDGAELVDGCGLLGDYPTRSGLAKTVGDSLGHNHGGAKLHRSGAAYQRCRENCALVLKKIPAGNRETVAHDAGFESVAALVAWARTLPGATL